MLRVLVVGILMLSGCSGGSDAESHPVAVKHDAGKVVELSGKVTATRTGAPRLLAVGNPVAADDVIDTAADGSIVIELFHNNARWSLEAGIKSRVDESVAWGLPKQEMAQTVDHKTSAAGRHADRQAADTAVTATPNSNAKPEVEQDVEKDAEKDVGPRKTGADAPKPIKPRPPATKPPPDVNHKKPTDSRKPSPPEQPPGNASDSPSRQDIQTAMATVKPLIRSCGKKHGVTGTIKIAFKISPDGSASSVTVKQTPDQKVDACVIEAGKAVVLPKSRNGVSFTYPIIL